MTLPNPLIALKDWGKAGYTDIVLFGRFQPFHRGHQDLLDTLRLSDLRVHLVFNNKVDDQQGERNPFSAAQRMTMAKMTCPWITNMRDAEVYLGRPGVDVGDDVKRLSDLFRTLADPGKLVFAYFEKAEDRKTYRVDGETISDTHYVELVGQPRGEFPIQQITIPMIESATGRPHLAIDAKMFRHGQAAKDEVVYDLLHPEVAHYVRALYEEAERRLIPVGLVPYDIPLRTGGGSAPGSGLNLF